MAELRYRWGSHPPQESPAPPRATVVALGVGLQVVESDGRQQKEGGAYLMHTLRTVAWQGDVTPELRAWARWCALQVADLWSCPEVVRRYLETGDEALRKEVVRLSEPTEERHMAMRPGGSWQAMGCAWRASHDTPKSHVHSVASQCALNANSIYRHAGFASRDEAKAKQTAHLRRLLLQRALPEPLWPLIDADERVLCDALLERQGVGCG